MSDFTLWVNQAENDNLPCPLRAAIAHYQFVTIHPYYDGNGRTARLLATVILHRGGYDLKGLYSLEEYYAKNLQAYYNAISVGPSHNYYFGREHADISFWLDYFCRGMIDSFEKIKTHALVEYHKGFEDRSKFLRELTTQQEAVLTLFKKRKIITSSDIQFFFDISPRSARTLCSRWLRDKFLILKDPAKKSRAYELNPMISKKLFE
jgi:Fic family protein